MAHNAHFVFKQEKKHKVMTATYDSAATNQKVGKNHGKAIRSFPNTLSPRLSISLGSDTFHSSVQCLNKQGCNSQGQEERQHCRELTL